MTPMPRRLHEKLMQGSSSGTPAASTRQLGQEDRYVRFDEIADRDPHTPHPSTEPHDRSLLVVQGLLPVARLRERCEEGLVVHLKPIHDGRLCP